MWGCVSLLKAFFCVGVFLQGLVLGVFEKEGEEGSLHLTEAAAGFDQSLCGKLSELLKMWVSTVCTCFRFKDCHPLLVADHFKFCLRFLQRLLTVLTVVPEMWASVSWMDFVLLFGSLSSSRSQTLFRFTILTDCMHIFHEISISGFSGPLPASLTYTFLYPFISVLILT